MSKRIAKQISILVTAWLLAAALEYLHLPKEIRPLDGLAGIGQMSGSRMFLVTALLALLLSLLPNPKWVRWGMVYAFGLYAVSSLLCSFTWPFLGACLLVFALLIPYAVYGWKPESGASQAPWQERSRYPVLAGIGSALFFCFVSLWTVARVRSFSAPTYDFGIFSQMFYYLKETGLPMTTLERDGLLSHFAVHVSPIYYGMLPFYCLVPIPETLQVLQAAVLASAVIPLWKLGKHHRLHPGIRMLLCFLLLLYPAYAGGASYDLHENCFLTPLILWLLYGMDSRNIPITAGAAVLTLMVKEDAAVYVAVGGLYLLVRSLLNRDKWGLLCGGSLIFGAVAWFLAVTGYLSRFGDGVMSYRYGNFMYDGSDSLITVIKAVLLCPMKAVYECVDTEKLTFIGLTLAPLLGLPLATRRYERLILLIPYLLVNLMSDYPYQHSIFFQYTFGAAGCLIYLVLVNLSDWNSSLRQLAALGLALAVCFGCFYEVVIPKAWKYVSYCSEYAGHYENQRSMLDAIPEEASVAATTFYTTELSSRDVLYDIRYSSDEHILSCEYIVIRVTEDKTFRRYEENGKQGKENFTSMLKRQGYILAAELPGVMEIYRKAP